MNKLIFIGACLVGVISATLQSTGRLRLKHLIRRSTKTGRLPYKNTLTKLDL